MDDGAGNDPPESSLFNVDTIKAMYEAGINTVDIVENPTTDVATLDISKFSPLTTKLMLDKDE
jgi:hypothetical protein